MCFNRSIRGIAAVPGDVLLSGSSSHALAQLSDTAVRHQYPLAATDLNWNDADSYTYGSTRAVWAFKVPFEARLTWHATDSAAKRLFPEWPGNRVEFALQASF